MESHYDKQNLIDYIYQNKNLKVDIESFIDNQKL